MRKNDLEVSDQVRLGDQRLSYIDTSMQKEGFIMTRLISVQSMYAGRARGEGGCKNRGIMGGGYIKLYPEDLFISEWHVYE